MNETAEPTNENPIVAINLEQAEIQVFDRALAIIQSLPWQEFEISQEQVVKIFEATKYFILGNAPKSFPLRLAVRGHNQVIDQLLDTVPGDMCKNIGNGFYNLMTGAFTRRESEIMIDWLVGFAPTTIGLLALERDLEPAITNFFTSNSEPFRNSAFRLAYNLGLDLSTFN